MLARPPLQPYQYADHRVAEMEASLISEWLQDRLEHDHRESASTPNFKP